MEGCIAPSEIPGITSQESSVFGQLAEDLIYMDFCTQYFYPPTDVFVDSNNPAGYLYFLVSHNPSFSQPFQMDFYGRLYEEELMRVPDILIHTFLEKSFYEIKPDSQSGRRAGIEKVGILAATYPFYYLPYTPGLSYRPREIIVASFGTQLQVKFKARLAGPGLIVYKLCLYSNGIVEWATLAAILRYVVRKMNEQRGRRTFRPVDLAPAFAREGELSILARGLGLAMAATVATVGWRFFWRAVARRFAVRAGVAALLAGADGPLPVGDLIAAGMALWTIVDIIRLSNVLWDDAARIAQQEA